MASTTYDDILELVRGLSDKHVLKRRPQEYIDGFARAALSTYKAEELLNQLQHKFFIPDDSRFTEETFLQSASELTVASHIRVGVSDFEIEKNVNPSNNKDVDVHYRIGSTRVCLEVKCPFEEPLATGFSYTVLSSGHTRSGPESVRAFVSRANSQSPDNSQDRFVFEEGKNREWRLKEALVGAHNKFPNASGLDDLNVLFIACDDFIRMSEWHGNLLGEGGLFTRNSFHPSETFRNVDCVILSNLKYRHRLAFSFPAWSLDDVLLVPIINPHGRTNLFDATLTEGLSIFSHYRREFLPDRERGPSERIQAWLDPHTKVTWFVYSHLNESEKSRFFPIWPKLPNLIFDTSHLTSG